MVGEFCAGVGIVSEAGLAAGLGSTLPDGAVAALAGVAPFTAAELDRSALEVVMLEVIALSGFNRWSLLGPRPSLISARESGTSFVCHP